MAPTASRRRYCLSVFLFASLLSLCTSAHAQKPAAEAPKTPATPVEPQTPAQIDLLETKVTFESNGDSRKEVHCIVKINSELGVRQFARLNFDYNRSFEKIEIPQVRVTHSNGGVADVLPSAISDNPNPAVVNAPAYQDVRVKSVRILGLAPSDTLEYRVITTTTKHPLAPDFWLDHTFDRTGIVSHEIFALDFPAGRNPLLKINPATPSTSSQKSGEGDNARVVYLWERKQLPELTDQSPGAASDSTAKPDLAVSTFRHWRTLSMRLADALTPGATPIDLQRPREEQLRQLNKSPIVPATVSEKAAELTHSARYGTKAQLIYDFVATKVKTVDLPLGATGFSVRTSDSILSSGYATQEDKFVLFAALAKAAGFGARPVLTGFSDVSAETPPMPSVFRHLYITGGESDHVRPMDPSLEVAPFGVLGPIKEDFVFLVNRAVHLMPDGPSYDVDSSHGVWQESPKQSGIPQFQKVEIGATLNVEGTLAAKVRYIMRGANELTLRLAFHQSPRDKWNEVAQLLALSDGFRGKIENVSASDPYATKDPFIVEYEISQPKFVDWSKKPVRIPAILPLVGLPDPPTKSGPIELGTPLDVTTTVTLHLPPGTTVESPAGTAVDRDYARFSSTYAATGNTLTASRHIQFLLRQLPADRATDYNAFLHAVQNDQNQRFTLQTNASK